MKNAKMQSVSQWLTVTMKSLLVLVFYVFGVLAKHEIYDGHSVYQVDVENLNQTEILYGASDELGLDVWNYPLPGRAGYVLVPKLMKTQFENTLNDGGLQYKIEVENIKVQLDLEDQRLAAAEARDINRTDSRLSFDRIHTWQTVDAYLDNLGRRFPRVVTVVTAGQSFARRPIKYLRISTNNFQTARKPVIMLMSLLHAREWVTLPATLYAIQKLVVDVTESDMIQNYDWIILPIANPDGYVWSHSNARFWRKNRRTGLNAGNTCIGVDLNRNFNVRWGTASSNNVCSDTFHGARANSEPETVAISAIINRYRSRLALYIDIHSFGSMIIYDHAGQLPPNALVKHTVGVTQARAIDRVKWPTNRNYIVGHGTALLYRASGTSSCFVTNRGIPFSYTYELPAFRNVQNNVNGFLVDPAFIEQAGFETWEGIKAGARDVLRRWR